MTARITGVDLAAPGSSYTVCVIIKSVDSAGTVQVETAAEHLKRRLPVLSNREGLDLIFDVVDTMLCAQQAVQVQPARDDRCACTHTRVWHPAGNCTWQTGHGRCSCRKFTYERS